MQLVSPSHDFSANPQWVFCSLSKLHHTAAVTVGWRGRQEQELEGRGAGWRREEEYHSLQPAEVPTSPLQFCCNGTISHDGVWTLYSYDYVN